MWKNNRPEGWNTFEIVVETLSVERNKRKLGIEEGSKALVEAGADAMLEALKECLTVRRITLPAHRGITNDLSDFKLSASGWLVFIPDEEQ